MGGILLTLVASVLLWGCGDDASMMVDAGLDALDASLDAQVDAGGNTLQPRVDAVLAALEPWAAAGWYDTIVIGMREGDVEAYGGIGTVDGAPVGVFLITGNCIWLNKISCSCLVTTD